MAYAQVVLKWVTSTPCQSPNFMNRLIPNLAWVIMFRGTTTLLSLVWIGTAVLPPGGGEIYGSCDFYYFFSRDRVPSKPVYRFLRIIAQKTRSDARRCLLGFRIENFKILGLFYPKNTPKMARNRLFTAKTKMSNNL